MNTYNPDRWVVLEFEFLDVTSGETEIVQKVFAGWYGGYAGSDSWKLNSGITEIWIDGDRYEFAGSSGSVYQCHKNGYGMSSYMTTIYSRWLKIAEQQNLKIRLLELEEIK